MTYEENKREVAVRSVLHPSASISLSNTSHSKDENVGPTDGKKYKHPIQEAAQAEQRLNEKARCAFDEFQILHFRATNAKPFPFEWVDLTMTEMEYSSVLTRMSREYERRFQ
jgi:hypothetical protein